MGMHCLHYFTYLQTFTKKVMVNLVRIQKQVKETHEEGVTGKAAMERKRSVKLWDNNEIYSILKIRNNCYALINWFQRKRDSFLKQNSILDEMLDDNPDIYMTIIHDWYAARPNSSWTTVIWRLCRKLHHWIVFKWWSYHVYTTLGLWQHHKYFDSAQRLFRAVENRRVPQMFR